MEVSLGSRWTVLVTDYDYPDLEIERKTLTAWRVRLASAQCTTPEQVIDHAGDVNALMTQFAPITKEVLDNLPHCTVVGRYGIGVDNIDVDTATARGIAVVNVPSYCEEEVAEHTIALLFGWARRVCYYTHEIQNNRWDWKTGRPIHKVQDSVLGIIGFGKIGRAVARKANALGMEVIAHDPYLPEQEFSQRDVKSVPLDDLLRASDFVSLHVPLTLGTRHFINDSALALMKHTACLINTSRGPVVDMKALADALRKKRIAGACLDVTEPEPLGRQSPLLQMKNALLTPHVAWYSDRSQVLLRSRLSEDVGRALHGIRPYGLVNTELASTFKEPRE